MLFAPWNIRFGIETALIALDGLLSTDAIFLGGIAVGNAESGASTYTSGAQGTDLELPGQPRGGFRAALAGPCPRGRV